MTTLIAIYTSDGLVGRCDAKCYDAHLPDCDCICHGRNHGQGREKAIDTTRHLATQWIEEVTRHEAGAGITATLHEECQQDTLWSASYV